MFKLSVLNAAEKTFTTSQGLEVKVQNGILESLQVIKEGVKSGNLFGGHTIRDL